MAKDARIGFRIPADLKRALTRIASEEGRSLAQICEIFLRGALAAYDREGSKYLRRFVTQQYKQKV